MTALGWLLMLTSTLSMTTLTLWCFYRVLTASDDRTDSDREPNSN